MGDGKRQVSKTETSELPLEKCCFNIIDSVKGGSGKTSLSLMLSLAAQSVAEQQSDCCSLLLDMDMQGSALEHLLFGTPRSPRSGGENPVNDEQRLSSNKAKHTLNDAILKYYRQEQLDFISKPIFYFKDIFNSTGDGVNEVSFLQISTAMASLRPNDRERFRAVSRMNYNSQITYDAFHSGLKAILNGKNLNSYQAHRPQYVIFDMPPNSNGYSDCVLDLLLSQNEKITQDYPKNYFELMTLDSSHVQATMDWFEQFVEQEQYRFPDHFFFVFNNVPKCASGMDYYQRLGETVDAIRESLGQVQLREGTRKRIYFVGVDYIPEYLTGCCGGAPITGSNTTPVLSRGVLTPIEIVAQVDEIVPQINKMSEKMKGREETGVDNVEPTKKLLNLMRTKG